MTNITMNHPSIPNLIPFSNIEVNHYFQDEDGYLYIKLPECDTSQGFANAVNPENGKVTCFGSRDEVSKVSEVVISYEL